MLLSVLNIVVIIVWGSKYVLLVYWTVYESFVWIFIWTLIPSQTVTGFSTVLQPFTLINQFYSVPLAYGSNWALTCILHRWYELEISSLGSIPTEWTNSIRKKLLPGFRSSCQSWIRLELQAMGIEKCLGVFQPLFYVIIKVVPAKYSRKSANFNYRGKHH